MSTMPSIRLSSSLNPVAENSRARHAGGARPGCRPIPGSASIHRQIPGSRFNHRQIPGSASVHLEPFYAPGWMGGEPHLHQRRAPEPGIRRRSKPAPGTPPAAARRILRHSQRPQPGSTAPSAPAPAPRTRKQSARAGTRLALQRHVRIGVDIQRRELTVPELLPRHHRDHGCIVGARVLRRHRHANPLAAQILDHHAP